MKKKNDEVTLSDIMAIFLPKFWIILLVAIIGAVSFGLYASNKENTYTATTVIDVRTHGASMGLADIELANSIIIKVGERVKSEEFNIKIIDKIKVQYGDDAYPGLLNTNSIKNSYSYVPLDNGMLRVSVTTTNAALSTDIAKAFEDFLPDEFPDYSSKVLIAQPINHAKKPDHPNDKGVLKNAVIGFAVGAAVSTIAVWAFAVLDTTIRNKKKLMDTFEYPVLAVVPSSKNNKEA